ncbi:MAG: hypothetical protein ACKOUR_08050, partial [Planctomycetota bacterium]
VYYRREPSITVRRTSSPSSITYDGLPVRRALRTMDFQSVEHHVRWTSSPSSSGRKLNPR